MNSLTKLGTALTAVFVICLTAFILQLLCVLWRRRAFHRRSRFAATAEDDLESNRTSNSTTELFYTNMSTSKELLYFFCWKSQSGRIEPDHDVTAPPQNGIENRTEINTHDVDEDVLAKWHALYGPSRLLFTIKEEERDEGEVDSVTGSTNANDGNGGGNGNAVKRMCLRDCLEEEEEEDLALSSEVVMTVMEVTDGTPFSTPCASPQYFTPSPSPARELNAPEKGGAGP